MATVLTSSIGWPTFAAQAIDQENQLQPLRKMAQGSDRPKSSLGRDGLRYALGGGHHCRFGSDRLPASGSGHASRQLVQHAQRLLGANVACAQCHDHPLADWTQREFYELAAFFGPRTPATGIRERSATVSRTRIFPNRTPLRRLLPTWPVFTPNRRKALSFRTIMPMTTPNLVHRWSLCSLFGSREMKKVRLPSRP